MTLEIRQLVLKATVAGEDDGSHRADFADEAGRHRPEWSGAETLQQLKAEILAEVQAEYQDWLREALRQQQER
jgi:hypothetical protein